MDVPKSRKRRVAPDGGTKKRRTKSTPMLYGDDEFDPDVFEQRRKKPTRAKTTDATLVKRQRPSRSAVKEVDYRIPFPEGRPPVKRDAPAPGSTQGPLSATKEVSHYIPPPLESPRGSTVLDCPEPAPLHDANFMIDLSREELVLPTQRKREYDQISAITEKFKKSNSAVQITVEEGACPHSHTDTELLSTIPDSSAKMRDDKKADESDNDADELAGVVPAVELKSGSGSKAVLRDRERNEPATDTANQEEKEKEKVKSSETTPVPPDCNKKRTPHSPIRKQAGTPFRVGLSKRARIAPLLKIRPK